MSELKAKTEIKMGSERGFGIVFAAVFAIIALYPVFWGNDLRIWALAIAAIFLVLAFVFPDTLKPLNRLWFLFGLLLGKIISPIVMGIIFVLTIIPIGLIRQAIKKDPLNQRPDPSVDSYWIHVDAERATQSSMKNQL